jgi:hypothetical protein
MANVFTDVAADQNSGLVRDRVDGSKVTGNLCLARAQFTTTALTDTGDVIHIVELPKGAVVIPSLCRIEAEDWGTDVSLTIGDTSGSSDADRYSTAVSVATAGTKLFVSGVAGLAPYTLEIAAWITATVVDAGSISVDPDKDATFLIAYILP